MSLAGLLVGGASVPEGTTRAADAQTHSFGIYFVAFTPDKPWDQSALGDLANLQLAKEPVLCEKDILSYEFTNHTMLVKPEALARLPKPPVWHTPFVVVADGHRIYLGAFSTMESSFSTSVPAILVDFRYPKSALRIDRAYPAAGFAVGPDPRSDERVRAALAGLKRLK